VWLGAAMSGDRVGFGGDSASNFRKPGAGFVSQIGPAPGVGGDLTQVAAKRGCVAAICGEWGGGIVWVVAAICGERVGSCGS